MERQITTRKSVLCLREESLSEQNLYISNVEYVITRVYYVILLRGYMHIDSHRAHKIAEGINFRRTAVHQNVTS